MRVFVHDTTGTTRAPSAAIIYLCLYMKHQDWKDVNRVINFVKTHHSYSTPNIPLVGYTIEHNCNIRDNMLKCCNDDKLREEEERHRCESERCKLEEEERYNCELERRRREEEERYRCEVERRRLEEEERYRSE